MMKLLPLMKNLDLNTELSSLGTPEARTVLASKVGKHMTDFFISNPDAARAIVRTKYF
jgi:hypothetical protein